MSTIGLDALPLADIDILGRADGSDLVAGNAALAELVTHLEGEDQDAAAALEDDFLANLTSPAGNLLRVQHKLAVAVRLAGWTLDQEAGTYGAALGRLLSSAFADVVYLRQAELRRRELLSRPAERGPATVEPVLAEMRDLHRATADLLGEIVERVKKLEGGGGQAEAAA